MIIRIEKLEYDVVIGIYEWEKKQARPLRINIDMEFDGAKVFETLSIDDTVNYESISNSIKLHLMSKSFDLIEEVCRDIGKIVLSHKLVKRCTISVEKFYAISNANNVVVVESFVK